MKIFSLSPNGNGKGTGRMADSATQFCIHKYIVGAVSPPWRGGYKSKLALLIFAQTISIPVWYRYGFLLFLAVFEISSAKEHIFDSCKCITYLLGWVLSKISKKPYLYRTGIDMVFSIFSSSNFHGRTQMYSG